MKTRIKALALSVAVLGGVAMPAFGQEMSIAEAAMSNPDLSTLATAVQAAGVGDMLMNEGPFTVFAPTNEAFAKLPAGTLETLLKPESHDQLVALLQGHVVSGNLKLADIERLKTTGDSESTDVTTVSGTTLQVAVTGNVGRITDESGQVATTVTANVAEKNGVVHVIDTVLMSK